jgi:hypothetical protein
MRSRFGREAQALNQMRRFNALMIPIRASIVGPPDVATIAVSCRISQQSCFGRNLEWFSFDHGRPRL